MPAKTRPLGIQAASDRTVRKAVQIAIEPIFETQFLDMSYGFRPGKTAKDASIEIERLIKERCARLADSDIEGFL
jgi:RNA-directed DNA polymerase